MQDEQRIRERAHAIWEQEGRPEGQHEAHWARAAGEMEAEGRSGLPIDDPATAAVQPPSLEEAVGAEPVKRARAPRKPAAPKAPGAAPRARRSPDTPR